MLNKRRLFSVVLVLFAGMTLGCAHRKCAGEMSTRKSLQTDGRKGAAASTAEVFLTGMVLRDYVNHVDYPVDLTKISPNGIPIAPYVPLRFNHDVVLRVRQQVGDLLRDYHVLMGPDPDRDLYAEGQIRTSDATMGMGMGWMVLLGEIPVGESEWVEGSTDGTQWALRIWNHPDPNQVRHYVYNLEPAGSGQVIHLKHKSSGDALDLQPGQFIVVAPQSEALPKPDRIPSNDPFVGYMRRRAEVAGLDLE